MTKEGLRIYAETLAKNLVTSGIIERAVRHQSETSNR